MIDVCLTVLAIVGVTSWHIERHVTRAKTIEASVLDYLKTNIDGLLQEVRTDVETFKTGVKADVALIAKDQAAVIKELKEKVDLISKSVQLNNSNKQTSIFDQARNWKP